MPCSIRRCSRRCTVLAGSLSLAARFLIDSLSCASASARMTATVRATVPKASLLGMLRTATSDSEDVHGASAVIEAGDAPAGDVGHADLGASDLARAGTALQLMSDLDHLRYSGRSDRMPARDQATGDVHRNLAADLERAVLEQLHRLARLGESERIRI